MKSTLPTQSAAASHRRPFASLAAILATVLATHLPAAEPGKGLMSETEILQLLETRIGTEPAANVGREKIFQELEAEIKARGVDFRLVPQSEFRKKLYTFRCPGSVAPTLHDNFGPPGAQAGLFGKWTFNKIGGKVDFDKNDKRFRENESAVANVGTLDLMADGTYSWKVSTTPTVDGRWRAATAAEMRFQGGDGIVLLKAKAGWDWIVMKDRVTPLEGERIAAYELTTRQVKEFGRK